MKQDRKDLIGLAIGTVGIVAMAALGFFLVVFTGATENFSRVVYGLVDIPAFLAIIACAACLAVVAILRRGRPLVVPYRIGRIPVWSIALSAFLIPAAGVQPVYHGYAFSMDEWMTRLQGAIFLSGQVSAVVPEEWRALGREMYHSFAAYDVNTGRLASDYRPGMASIYSAFETVGLGLYASAVMNALSVLLVASLARQYYPQNSEAPAISALLLATSQQALAMSMTTYAMPAHLFFNLLWLSLFLRDRLFYHFLAAMVGVATASLHQIHMHFFFALPFLLTLLHPFRLRLILLYGVIYLFGHLAVNAWDWISISSWSDVPSEDHRTLMERVSKIAHLPETADLATVVANLVRLFAWQSLALGPLLVLGFSGALRRKPLRLLAWSVLISLLPYPFLIPDQGHGWGYRHLHGLLGHLALLAIPGWVMLRGHSGLPRVRDWVVSCLVIAPLILIPMRAWQIEKLVAGYAGASELAALQVGDIVVVDSLRIRSGQDIPRNAPIDPARPIQLHNYFLTVAQIEELCRRYRVIYMGPDAFEPFGLAATPIERLDDPDLYHQKLRALTDPACAN